MKDLQEILEIVRKYEDLIHKKEYEQFTIDFFQNTEMRLNAEIEDTDLTESYSEDIIKNIQYDTSCILQIIKECKDKELFSQFEKDIHQF